MSKAEIIAELPRLNPEERQEVLKEIFHLDHLAENEWRDNGELTDADKTLLDARLEEYEQDPDAGSSWEEVEARIRAKLR